MTVQPLPNPTDLGAVRAWLADRLPDPAAVRAWAAPHLAAADRYGPVPPLGSPRWRALPASDPRKLAALVPAALAHLEETTTAAVAARLRAELADADRLVVDRIRRASWDVSAAWSAAHRDETGELRIPPSHAELARRRATFPCLSCRTAPVLHPQTVCDACQHVDTAQPQEVAA